MIKNKKLLIDKDCPMCQMYGKGFTQLKWIDERTVSYYQSCPTNLSRDIDMERAKSEIAFHDPDKGTTKYGIDAFIEILWKGKIKRFLRIQPVYWALKKLYRFISFNRKVIAPAHSSVKNNDCTPPIHLGYRLIYIAFSIILFGVGLDYILKTFQNHFSLQIQIHPILLAAIPFGIQTAVLALRGLRSKLNYLGNMATVANISFLLVIPAVFIFQLLNLPLVYILLAIGLAGYITFLEIQTRTRSLKQPPILNFTWLVSHFSILLIPFLS